MNRRAWPVRRRGVNREVWWERWEEEEDRLWDSREAERRVRGGARRDCGGRKGAAAKQELCRSPCAGPRAQVTSAAACQEKGAAGKARRAEARQREAGERELSGAADEEGAAEREAPSEVLVTVTEGRITSGKKWFSVARSQAVEGTQAKI